MKLSEVINKLSLLDNEMNEKDTLLLQCYTVLDSVMLLLTDRDFITSEIYPTLKLKYLSSLEKKIELIRNKKIDISPLYIPVKKLEEVKHEKDIEKKDVEKKEMKLTKRPQLITAEVNTPLEPDIYLNPKSKPKLVLNKKQSTVINVAKGQNAREIAKIKTLYSIKYKEITCFINFDTGIIYNDNFEHVGSIDGKILKINDETINLNITTDPNLIKINEQYSLLP